MYLGLEVPMVTSCLTFWGSAKLFFKAAAPLYLLTSNMWGFLSLHTFSSILVIICLLLIILAMLVCVKWYFMVVLLYIFLKISDVEHLFTSYWVFAYHLWRSIYANTLPSCKLGSFSVLTCFLYTSPLSGIWLTITFFHSVGYLLTFLTGFFFFFNTCF